jgi:hypothetical protein
MKNGNKLYDYQVIRGQFLELCDTERDEVTFSQELRTPLKQREAETVREYAMRFIERTSRHKNEEQCMYEFSGGLQKESQLQVCKAEENGWITSMEKAIIYADKWEKHRQEEGIQLLHDKEEVWQEACKRQTDVMNRQPAVDNEQGQRTCERQPAVMNRQPAVDDEQGQRTCGRQPAEMNGQPDVDNEQLQGACER